MEDDLYRTGGVFVFFIHTGVSIVKILVAFPLDIL